jgi:hypothetical protein
MGRIAAPTALGKSRTPFCADLLSRILTQAASIQFDRLEGTFRNSAMAILAAQVIGPQRLARRGIARLDAVPPRLPNFTNMFHAAVIARAAIALRGGWESGTDPRVDGGGRGPAI